MGEQEKRDAKVVHLRQPEARPDSNLYLDLAQRAEKIAEDIRHVRVLAGRLGNPPLGSFFADIAEHEERFRKLGDGFAGAVAMALQAEAKPPGAA